MDTNVDAIILVEEPFFTAGEIAKKVKLTPETVHKIFLDEPGVRRFGHGATRTRKQRYTCVVFPGPLPSVCFRA